MSVKTIDIEKEISKYNREVRKNRPWKKWSDEKFRTTKANEEGKRTVNIGSKNWGCEIIYCIENDHLNVSEFDPKSGGMILEFSSNEAEKGLIYLLGLSSVLNMKSLTIRKKIYETKNASIFRKYGFSYSRNEENFESTFTMSFLNGEFHSLRKKHISLDNAIKTYKEKDISFKCNWMNNDSSKFKYEYYINGIKGVFHLGINSEEENYVLKEDTLEITMNISKNSELATVDSEFESFLSTIKEKGKLKALLNPSDEIFKEFGKKKLNLDKEYQKMIFTRLTEEYDQEEMDERLLKDDYDFIKEFEYSKSEIQLYRILDLYFLFDKKNEEMQIFGKEDKVKAKNIFFELSVIYFKENMESILEEMK